MEKSFERKLRVPLGALSAVVLLAGVALYEGSRAQARPAETKAAPPAAAEKGRIFAEGRLVAAPGGEVTISSEVAGLAERVLVQEDSWVKEGDLLVEINVSVEKAELAAANARAKAAQVDLSYLERELARTEKLASGRVLTDAELDKARYSVEAARARLASENAATRILSRRIDKAQVRAPIGGQIVSQMVDAGEVVPVGGALFTIVDFSRVQVEAEVGEFDTSRLSSGAKVRVSAEGFDGVSWPGVVMTIPSWVTNRRLKPLDPGRPSDTRILPVKISLQAEHPLKLGQRVEVEIEGSSSESRPK